jgi:hypothetical protein
LSLTFTLLIHNKQTILLIYYVEHDSFVLRHKGVICSSLCVYGTVVCVRTST